MNYIGFLFPLAFMLLLMLQVMVFDFVDLWRDARQLAEWCSKDENIFPDYQP